MDLDKYTKSGSFMKKEDVPLDPGVLLTIEDIVEPDPDSDIQKPVLHFAEDYPPLALNKTNLRRLIMMLETSNSKQMIGAAVRVYHDDMVEYAGSVVGGVRLGRPTAAQQDDINNGKAKPGKDEPNW